MLVNFYNEWERARDSGASTEQFFEEFLDATTASLDLFNNGEVNDVIKAVKFLLSVPMTDFIENIKHPYSFVAKDVVQFSNLDDAITKLCNILEYEESELSILEAGKRLTHAKGEYACIKYGENHSKTAEALSLVRFSKPYPRKGRVVSNTTLGCVSTTMSQGTKLELIKRLAIRNKTEKALIFELKNHDRIWYDEFISQALSGQTKIRRRTNVKQITSLILQDNKLLDRIEWY